MTFVIGENRARGHFKFLIEFWTDAIDYITIIEGMHGCDLCLILNDPHYTLISWEHSAVLVDTMNAWSKIELFVGMPWRPEK